MSKTASNMLLALGSSAPEFSLLDVVSDSVISMHADPSIKATVIFFICNHCPYVKHINKELTQLANYYIAKKVRFLAINSNDVENYPDDSPENMRITARTEGYPFPYLYDQTQEVARAYQAACTPDIFLFDAQLKLIYRGQFDDSRPGNTIPVNGASLREALNQTLANKPVDTNQKPSLGCNIKWKKT